MSGYQDFCEISQIMLYRTYLFAHDTGAGQLQIHYSAASYSVNMRNRRVVRRIFPCVSLNIGPPISCLEMSRPYVVDQKANVFYSL